MAMNIKKGDTVVVLSGKDKGKKGKVLTVMPKDGKVIKPDGWEDPAPKIKAYIDAVIARKAQK